MFRRAVHPGQILADELDILGIPPAAFAQQIDVPAKRVVAVISGDETVTDDLALRFGDWFGTEPQFWLNLQDQHDLCQQEAATTSTPPQMAHPMPT